LLALQAARTTYCQQLSSTVVLVLISLSEEGVYLRCDRMLCQYNDRAANARSNPYHEGESNNLQLFCFSHGRNLVSSSDVIVSHDPHYP
jgi:hypothetical protein